MRISDWSSDVCSSDLEPYKFAVVRTSPNCQPRARFVDAAKAKPSEATGWKFNDLIRVPSAACPSQRAVVRVWRKPVVVGEERDGQGQARIYLEEALNTAAAGKLPAIPRSEERRVGKGCVRKVR